MCHCDFAGREYDPQTAISVVSAVLSNAVRYIGTNYLHRQKLPVPIP